MVTTQPHPAHKADRQTAGRPSASAAPTSVAASDLASTPARPGATKGDTFGSHLDRAASPPTASTVAPAQTAAAADPAAPVASPPQVPPSPGSDVKTVDAGPAVETAMVEKAADEDEPTADPTLLAQPLPQPPSPIVAPPPPAAASLPGSVQTGSGAVSAEAGDAAQGPNGLSSGLADKPTSASAAAQLAARPSLARPIGQTDSDKESSATETAADATQTSHSASAIASKLPSNLLVPSAAAQATPPSTTPIVQPSAQPSALQPAPTQRGTIALASPGRTAKMSPDVGAAPSPASPPASPPGTEIAPSNTASFDAMVTTASNASTLTPAPTAAASSATKMTQQPLPSSPATQVAAAIIEPVKVVMSSGAQTASTTSHVTTIQITPAELGRVDIRIERSAAGPATIQLVAERPETLSRLVHDQSQLQQALDQAGVPQAGRTLDFSLAPPPSTNMGSGSPSFAGGSMNGGASSGNGHQRGGSYANQGFGTANDAAVSTQFRSIRSGIDITA